MQFVDQIVPEDVTNISTIRDAWEDFEELEDEGEVEEIMEDKIIESKAAGQLFTPHPRFPCLSETVSLQPKTAGMHAFSSYILSDSKSIDFQNQLLVHYKALCFKLRPIGILI